MSFPVCRGRFPDWIPKQTDCHFPAQSPLNVKSTNRCSWRDSPAPLHRSKRGHQISLPHPSPAQALAIIHKDRKRYYHSGERSSSFPVWGGGRE
ncbi:hypothetical protein chiPu_0024307 [Chiloscyllium punctatum]|uniref:Uncharacterized protein n=1 Tax=Chiloscyllium punctatum TaxID=137246 RepID=A0A401TC13_CHIPU|nr:hypothetical protein [Chiloscyllium punctatum]